MTGWAYTFEGEVDEDEEPTDSFDKFYDLAERFNDESFSEEDLHEIDEILATLRDDPDDDEELFNRIYHSS